MNITDQAFAPLPGMPEPGAPAANAGEAAYAAKATRAAVQFEGFFIAHILHQMRSGTRELAGADGAFKDPVNSDMLDMADTLVADKMAGHRAFGIADAILRQLLPSPPAPPPAPAPGNVAPALKIAR